MANAINAAVAGTIVADQALTLLSAVLAPLNAFTTKFSISPLAPRDTVVVPLIKTQSAVVTNATDFEAGDTTISGSVVTVSQYTAMWKIDNNDFQKGLKLDMLAQYAIRGFGIKLLDVALNVVDSTYATSSAEDGTASAATFGATQLKLMRADLAAYPLKHLILDGTAASQLIPTDLNGFPIAQGLPRYGFDAVWETSRLAAATCSAIVCDPQAICIASGLPKQANSNLLTQEVFTVPGINLPVLYSTWFSTKLRAECASLDVMFGAADGDTSALFRFAGA